jgi:hypothetical protein
MTSGSPKKEMNLTRVLPTMMDPENERLTTHASEGWYLLMKFLRERLITGFLMEVNLTSTPIGSSGREIIKSTSALSVVR